jgi:lipopolysaccharide heptosyltransferase I
LIDVPEYKLPDDISRILVVKPSSLGDIVHSLPFLNALRDRFKGAEIHWVVARGLEGLLEGHPMIDRLWIINKDQWRRISRAAKTAGELKKLFSDLKREKFDLVVDLQGLLRSSLMTLATRAKFRVGFKEAREGSTLFYTHRVRGRRDIHAVDRYMRVAASLGCEASNIRFPLLVEPCTPGFDKYAVMAPGARWRTKMWPPERFGKLASLLPVKSVVIGSTSDEEVSDIVVRNSEGKAISLSGRTNFKELAGLIRNARFIVCNDTGPMHIAAALNVPAFAVFGPTNPARTGPYGNIHTIIREDLDCAPCYRRMCDDLRCMDGVTADKVFNIIREKGL